MGRQHQPQRLHTLPYALEAFGSDVRTSLTVVCSAHQKENGENVAGDFFAG